MKKGTTEVTTSISSESDIVGKEKIQE